MEIALCLFLGVWISAAGVCGYIWTKKEMSPFMDKNIEKKEEFK